MLLASWILLLGPSLSLLVATARQPMPRRRPLMVLALLSTACWLVYVGLYPHERPCGWVESVDCPTIYGTRPLLDHHSEGQGGWLVFSSFVFPASIAGWLRSAPPLWIGSSLLVGPFALAWSTTPRVDNDGLWLVMLPMLGVVGGEAEHHGRDRRRTVVM